MSKLEHQTIEHLRSLQESVRQFMKRGSYNKNCPFWSDMETELVRAEDFLEEVVGDADPRI